MRRPIRSLFISTERPEPGYGAGERSLSICKALARLGEVASMVVAYPGGLHYDARSGENVVRMVDSEESATRWYWRKRKYLLSDFRRDSRVANFVRKLHAERPFDAFFGRYKLPLLAACAELGPTFVDLDDVPVDLAQTRPALLRMAQRLTLRNALAPLRRIFVTKQADVARVAHRSVAVLPCISTQPEESRTVGPPSAAQRLLFVGGMRWPPNRDGVEHFLDHVFPEVLARMPQARLRLVGEGGEFAAGRPGVDVVGFVKELADEYARASVVIVPVRSGAGSCVKLAEAAGFGRPIVATPFAACGYEGFLVPGRDLVVGATDHDFAESCVELLRDPTRRNALAESARSAAGIHLCQGAVDRVIHAAVEAAVTTRSDVPFAASLRSA